MIKARKGDLIILGLSDENMRRLKNNEPIKFALKELLPDKDVEDMTVIIMNGRTEDSLALSLQELTKPQN